MKQPMDTPTSLFKLSVLLSSMLQTSAEVGEVLLHRTPTERIDGAGLLVSNKVHYRTGQQRKALCEVKANTGISCGILGRFLSCGADCVCSSQSPELSCELSSPAAFQFFLLLFFKFGPESESLWESCFRLFRL